METTLSSRTVYQGRVLTVDVADVALPDGRRSTREMLRHRGSVAVLGRLPAPDARFVLVRQFRKAIDRDLLEVVAGTLEEGEHPDDCARRELREETGYEAVSLVSLGVIFPAPGYSSERLHVYHADLSVEQGRLRPDEDEKLTVMRLAENEIERMIRQGEIQDSKTLALWALRRAMGAVP